MGIVALVKSVNCNVQLQFNHHSNKIYLVCTSTFENIRIHHDCEGRIEKSVRKITAWHHEAYRVMPNGESRGTDFLSHPHTYNGLLSCSSLDTAFYV